ncbi:MAG: luciferase, partial [uncultured Thermomicrobiales bacterium]
AVRVCHPQGRCPHGCRTGPRGGGGGMGWGVLLGRDLHRVGVAGLRSVGRDGRDGDAYRARADRRAADAALAPPPLEGRPRDGHPRSPLAGAARPPGRPGGGRHLRQGGRSDRPQGAGAVARRELGDPDRTVERATLQLP